MSEWFTFALACGLLLLVLGGFTKRWLRGRREASALRTHCNYRAAELVAFYGKPYRDISNVEIAVWCALKEAHERSSRK